MTYEVRLDRQAGGYLRRLDRRTQERFLRRLRQIAQDRYCPYTKLLINAGGRRAARVGDWRIVFAVDEENRLVKVSYIGSRGDIYNRL